MKSSSTGLSLHLYAVCSSSWSIPWDSLASAFLAAARVGCFVRGLFAVTDRRVWGLQMILLLNKTTFLGFYYSKLLDTVVSCSLINHSSVINFL